jgi:hypothetical protein
MKRIIQIITVILISIVLFIFIKADLASAQGCGEFCGAGGTCDWGYHCDAYGLCVNDWLNCPSCVGDTGKHGACRLIQDCPSGWDDGDGDCISTPYDYYECCIVPTPTPTPLPYGTCKCDPDSGPICVPAPFGNNCRLFEHPLCLKDQFGQCTENCICVDSRVTPTPTPSGPTATPRPTPKLQCGDICSVSTECDQSAPQYLVCDPNWKLCESPITCPICFGTLSGNVGVCLDAGVCGNVGKNPNDGVGTCVDAGDVCCTNFANLPSCQLNPVPPYYAQADILINLTSPISNQTYTTQATSGCTCFPPINDDPYHSHFYCRCFPAGTYTISATNLAHNITCSSTIDITQGPNPYPPCIGHFTQRSGECHYMECPLTTTWDGINPPYSDTGCPFGDTCCVYGTDGEIVPRPQLVVGCEKDGQLGINTALGCIILTSTTSFFIFILPWALGVGGGTAFILIIVGGFLLMTSGGNPQRTKAAKELLTSAIIGLLMIIFSVYILDLIGIRILNIPGL